MIREMPELTLTIASHNRRDKLKMVLESLSRQQLRRERFEVVVVLDGSQDNSGEMIRSLDVAYPLRLIEKEKGSVASRATAALEGRSWCGSTTTSFQSRPFSPTCSRAQRDQRGVHRTRRLPAPNQGHRLLGAAVEAWWSDHFRRKGEPDHRWTCIDFCEGNFSLPLYLFHDTSGWDERFTAVRRQDGSTGSGCSSRRDFEYRPEAFGWHHLDTSFETACRNRRREALGDVMLATMHPEVGTASTRAVQVGVLRPERAINPSQDRGAPLSRGMRVASLLAAARSTCPSRFLRARSSTPSRGQGSSSLSRPCGRSRSRFFRWIWPRRVPRGAAWRRLGGAGREMGRRHVGRVIALDHKKDSGNGPP